MEESLLAKQNIIFKSILILIGIIYSFFLRFEIVMLLMGFNVLYFLFDVKLLKLWFHTIIKVSSFVMSYLIFAMILQIEYLTQLDFLIRLIYLLQLSIYFTQSAKLSNTISDCSRFIKYRVFYVVFYFLLTLSTSMVVLKNSWNHQIQVCKKKYDKQKLNASDYINLIMLALEEGADKIHIIEKQANKIMQNPIEKKPLITLANLLLMYNFTIYILIISL